MFINLSFIIHSNHEKARPIQPSILGDRSLASHEFALILLSHSGGASSFGAAVGSACSGYSSGSAWTTGGMTGK